MADLLERHAKIPDTFGKGLVACIRCRLVKTLRQFVTDGCENCPFLTMDGDPERCQDCTTSSFQGLAAIVDPMASWVAKWQLATNFAPGCYALSVDADLPPEMKDILENNGIRWRRQED